MNIAEHKLNLFRQIDELPDELLLELETVIAQLKVNQKSPTKRQFGCMKGLVISMSEAFDRPLDDFNEYMP